MDPVHDRRSMDPVHESGPWTQSMKVVHGPSPRWVHVLSSPVLTIMCILSVSLCLCVLINQIAGRFIVLF